MSAGDLFDIEDDTPASHLVVTLPSEQPPGAEPGPEVEEPTTFYGSADEWVRKFLRPTYVRRVAAKGQNGGDRWAAAWWGSVEAMIRVEVLWRMWDHARKSPVDLSAWMISHLDMHMGVLLSASGPFATSMDDNRPGELLPYVAPPEGMFPPDHQP